MKKILFTVLLLIGSNFAMNFAWYGLLKYKNYPLILMILASWGIAFFEYCLQVPANRLGDQVLTLVQLKVAQETITLITFTVLAALLWEQKLHWNNYVSYGLIILAAWFSFKKW